MLIHLFLKQNWSACLKLYTVNILFSSYGQLVDERVYHVILPKVLLCLLGVILQDQKHNFLLYLIMDVNMRSL